MINHKRHRLILNISDLHDYRTDLAHRFPFHFSFPFFWVFFGFILFAFHLVPHNRGKKRKKRRRWRIGILGLVWFWYFVNGPFLGVFLFCIFRSTKQKTSWNSSLMKRVKIFWNVDWFGTENENDTETCLPGHFCNVNFLLNVLVHCDGQMVVFSPFISLHFFLFK